MQLILQRLNTLPTQTADITVFLATSGASGLQMRIKAHHCAPEQTQLCCCSIAPVLLLLLPAATASTTHLNSTQGSSNSSKGISVSVVKLLPNSAGYQNSFRAGSASKLDLRPLSGLARLLLLLPLPLGAHGRASFPAGCVIVAVLLLLEGTAGDSTVLTAATAAPLPTTANCF